jgi:hypothetical protein
VKNINQDERRAMRILQAKDPQFDEVSFRKWCKEDSAHDRYTPEMIVNLYIMDHYAKQARNG